MFRFCRVIEDRRQQYLLRAANDVALVGFGHGCHGYTAMLTIDITITTPDGSDWYNMRMALPMVNQLVLLQALECFNKEHAREAFRLLDGAYRKTLSQEELKVGQQALGKSVEQAIDVRYGAVG